MLSSCVGAKEFGARCRSCQIPQKTTLLALSSVKNHFQMMFSCLMQRHDRAQTLSLIRKNSILGVVEQVVIKCAGFTANKITAMRATQNASCNLEFNWKYLFSCFMVPTANAHTFYSVKTVRIAVIRGGRSFLSIGVALNTSKAQVVIKHARNKG